VLKIGIVGLAQVGKTTLFRILTHAHGSGLGSGRPEAHVGVVRVPDARLDRLSEMYHPKKTVHASVEYVDTPGSVIDLARAGAQMAALREMDALAHVVRAFDDPANPPAGGLLDPKRDIESVELELILSDLAVVEKRLERLEKDLKKHKDAAIEKEGSEPPGTHDHLPQKRQHRARIAAHPRRSRPGESGRREGKSPCARG